MIELRKLFVYRKVARKIRVSCSHVFAEQGVNEKEAGIISHIPFAITYHSSCSYQSNPTSTFLVHSIVPHYPSMSQSHLFSALREHNYSTPWFPYPFFHTARTNVSGSFKIRFCYTHFRWFSIRSLQGSNPVSEIHYYHCKDTRFSWNTSKCLSAVYCSHFTSQASKSPPINTLCLWVYALKLSRGIFSWSFPCPSGRRTTAIGRWMPLGPWIVNPLIYTRSHISLPGTAISESSYMEFTWFFWPLKISMKGKPT